MKKHLILLSLLSLCTSFLCAQQIGEWQVYPSYYSATQNIAVGQTVYSISEGNLLSYHTDDSEVRTYDCLHNLNGVRILCMGYSSQARRLILVYDDTNIDLMDADGQVINMPSLRDKTLTGKAVSRVYVYGTMAYLVTGFGLVEVDMKEAVFGNTYHIDHPIRSLAISDDTFFLGTSDGLYACAKDKNMNQASNWELIEEERYYDDLAWFDGNLVGRRNWNIYRVIPEWKSSTSVSRGPYYFMSQSGDRLIWGSPDKVVFCENLSTLNEVTLSNAWNDVSFAGGLFWVSEGEGGLNAYKYENRTFVKAVGPIQPNSPKHDLFYRMQWIGDRLLVAGGINTVEEVYNPPTAMYFEDGQWTNFTEMDIPSEYSHFNFYNTTHIVQDPTDASHHFASLYREGLCEYRDGRFVRFYNSDNSPLCSILPDEPRGFYYNYVSCSGLQYDADGNLWMLNSETDTIVRFLRPNGKWGSLYYGEIAGVSLCDDYLMHSSGLMFLNSHRMDNRGFFCFDTRGTLDNVRDDRHRLRSVITNQDGTSYSPDAFYCMTEDLDGRIWCGTNLGIFVINNAEAFFDDDFQFEQVKISRNDGSGLADYLLSGVPVSCVTIDGANRKWVGTVGNGIYLISADGTEMIHHFMEADSPLLGDNILSIAVHPTSGLVMIGTEKGLCSYNSDATEGAQSLDYDNVLVFPNPVSPDYTGPIVVRGLTMDSEVKILSSSGQLVWSGTSAGGTFTWNGCNRNGRRVASGVYHVVANNAEGKKAIVARLIMIK